MVSRCSLRAHARTKRDIVPDRALRPRKMRDRYRGPGEAREAAAGAGISQSNPAFQEGGTIEQMSRRVAEEGGTEQVETWIAESIGRTPNPASRPGGVAATARSQSSGTGIAARPSAHGRGARADRGRGRGALRRGGPGVARVAGVAEPARAIACEHSGKACREGGSTSEMVEEILAAVREGKRVCAVFYGHPGVYVKPSHEAVRRARKEGFEARMLPGGLRRGLPRRRPRRRPGRHGMAELGRDELAAARLPPRPDRRPRPLAGGRDRKARLEPRSRPAAGCRPWRRLSASSTR